MLSKDGTSKPFIPNAVLAAALSRISKGSLGSNVPTSSRYLIVRLLQVNEKNSFAGAAATGGAGGSLVTPGSKGAPFWATAAGLSRWKIWLFVHLAPPWQEAQLAPNTVSPAVVSAGFGWCSGRTAAKIHRVCASSASLPPWTIPWS